MKKTIIVVTALSLSILVASVSAETYTKNMNFSFTVEPGFLLQAAPSDGGLGIEFGDVTNMPRGSKITREVNVRVISNTGTSYKVIQSIDRPFSDSQGNPVAEGTVKFYVRATKDTKGKVEVPVAVDAEGEKVIFTSNARGQTDSFVLVYEFKSPGMVAAGKYLTSITLRAVK